MGPFLFLIYGKFSSVHRQSLVIVIGFLSLKVLFRRVKLSNLVKQLTSHGLDLLLIAIIVSIFFPIAMILDL